LPTERTIGGWCGCAALLPFLIVFPLLLEDAMHGIDGYAWIVFWLAAVMIPILTFQLVKMVVNFTSRLLRPGDQ
jgi:hypothetical protein